MASNLLLWIIHERMCKYKPEILLSFISGLQISALNLFDRLKI